MTCDDVRDHAAGFVLDALEPDEMAAVREHLATCPEAHAEIADLAASLPVLAASVPVVEPPARLGARIRAAAEADLATRAGSVAPGPEPAPSRPVVVAAAPASVGTPRGSSAGSWALRIAAVLAIAVLGGWNLLLQQQLSSAQAYEQSVAEVIAAAGQPGSLTAVLTADGGGPSGLAAISATGEVTLAMQALPATAGQQVYEAWVIGGDGVPVPLGSFQVGSAGTASFSADSPLVEPGVVLALTREPGPGATTPTLPIVAAGTASTAS
jgi:anti-sigma-K factor RskA